jgi:hypothetical protein
MITRHLSLILGVVLWVCALSAQSKDTPEAQAEADKGSKKGSTQVGGKSGESGLPPWFHTEAKLSELFARIRYKEEDLNKLIEQKNKLKEGDPKTKVLIDQITTEHKSLQNLINEYNQNLSELKYRFPERGMKVDRNYKKKDLKSVESIEQAVGVDSKLSQSLSKARSQFGAKKQKPQEKPVSDIKTEVESSKNIPLDPNKIPIDEQPALILNK